MSPRPQSPAAQLLDLVDRHGPVVGVDPLDGHVYAAVPGEPRRCPLRSVTVRDHVRGLADDCLGLPVSRAAVEAVLDTLAARARRARRSALAHLEAVLAAPALEADLDALRESEGEQVARQARVELMTRGVARGEDGRLRLADRPAPAQPSPAPAR